MKISIYLFICCCFFLYILNTDLAMVKIPTGMLRHKASNRLKISDHCVTTPYPWNLNSRSDNVFFLKSDNHKRNDFNRSPQHDYMENFLFSIVFIPTPDSLSPFSVSTGQILGNICTKMLNVMHKNLRHRTINLFREHQWY